MAEWVAKALRDAGCEPILAGGEPRLGLPSIPDRQRSRRGPVAGVAAALGYAANRDVVVVATDQPLVRPETIAALIGCTGDAVVPVDRGVRQTTCAVYRPECLTALEQALASGEGAGLQSIVDQVEATLIGPDQWTDWGEDGRSWWSLDSRSRLRAAETWEPGSPIPEQGGGR